MKTINVKDMVASAFDNLRKEGYVALTGFPLGWQAVPSEEKKVVFFSPYDEMMLNQTGGLFISWRGDGEEITKVLKDAGLGVFWDGNSDKKIWTGLTN